MLVSIMITTRNPLSEQQRTCRILKTLDPAPSEILITADGCSDGTVRFLRDSCPEFHLIVHDISRGSVASGAAMMEKAPGDLVLALDDDSYPEQSDCLSTLSDLFSQNARVAVATLPQRTDEYPEMLTRKDFGSPGWSALLQIPAHVYGFRPTAHCLALSQCFSTCTKNRITHYSA